MSSTSSTECFGALSIKYTGQSPGTDGEKKPEKHFKKVKSGVRVYFSFDFARSSSMDRICDIYFCKTSEQMCLGRAAELLTDCKEDGIFEQNTTFLSLCCKTF
jgi:hypothetical protein